MQHTLAKLDNPVNMNAEKLCETESASTGAKIQLSISMEDLTKQYWGNKYAHNHYFQWWAGVLIKTIYFVQCHW